MLRSDPALTDNAQPHRVQRVVAIGGTDLNDPAGMTLADAQQQVATVHLAHIVNNTAGDLLFTNQYRERLIRDTVRDMHQTTGRFNYASMADLARDVQQRVLTSLYMRQSQGSSRARMAFSYPDRASDGTSGVEAKVNDAAVAYWGPRLTDAAGNYYFELSPAGRANAYQAIVALFTEQTNPHRRTLIHCDYLVSVLEYRAWAESIGAPTYKAAVQAGAVTPVLKWNGFADLETPTILSMTAPPYFRVEQALTHLWISDERDLVIGDHVVFYNHETYDPLIEGTGGIWRLENAVLIDRVGGQNRYQGHGYFSPVPKIRLLRGMIRQYNRHVRAARGFTQAVDRATTPTQRTTALAELHARYPNVHEKPTGGWEVRGTGFCGTPARRDLRNLTLAEAPGLTHPCHGAIRVRRPVHTSP
jgi:hypothetical protein